MDLKNLLIIDGSYMLHRGLKQQPIFDMRNSELERMGGILSFFNILQKEIKQRGDYFPIVCWDNGLSERRLAIYSNYKEHEDKINDPEYKPLIELTDDEKDVDYVYNYKLQRKRIIEILDAFGIPSLIFNKTEGDDLMYWLAKHCKKSIIVTDDKDLLQLLADNCRVRQPMKNKLVTLIEFLEENNFKNVDDFIHVKALLGDPSDNIPSACFRVGEKTALDCLNVYYQLKSEDKLYLLKSEKELKKYCKNYGLAFKAAFCNFDESQYFTNLELIDLSRIQESELNAELIYERIRRVYKNKDICKPLELLNRHEIKTVNTNIIFESLVLTRHNIKD